MKEKETKTKTLEISVLDTAGKEVDTFKLPKVLCTTAVNVNLLNMAVQMYHNNQKVKCASTKTRGEVSGSGKKPWRQKGTGRARAGSIRSPIWRHGGTVFGPEPRDSHFSFSRQMKSVALKNSLIDKVNENSLIVLEKLNIEQPKTKLLCSILSALKLDGKALLLLEKLDKNLILAARNLAHLEVKLASDVNAFDILKFKKLVITKSALEQLTKRLK
jgi:large subunit ribosomal protein L4